MTLVSQQNNYINYRRKNGIAMLKSIDHDSMSGEQVGTTFELSCCYENCRLSVRQEDNYWNLKDIAEEEFFQIHPHGFMVRLGGELGK